MALLRHVLGHLAAQSRGTRRVFLVEADEDALGALEDDTAAAVASASVDRLARVDLAGRARVRAVTQVDAMGRQARHITLEGSHHLPQTYGLVVCRVQNKVIFVCGWVGG